MEWSKRRDEKASERRYGCTKRHGPDLMAPVGHLHCKTSVNKKVEVLTDTKAVSVVSVTFYSRAVPYWNS
jgi:hypothetical protein